MEQKTIEREKAEAEALALILRLSDAQIRELRKLMQDSRHTPDCAPIPTRLSV